VRHFFEWFAREIDAERPWLILGKGPSFAARGQFELNRFELLSLNHAARELPVRVAHMIDLDVVEACADSLEANAGVLVMPWYPHVAHRPGSRTLEELVPQSQVLSRLDRQGRLLWYDLSTAPERHGKGPVVRATYFSAEAALNLLALAGVRRVRSLGVDGGATYSGEFEDLKDKTLLANSRASFDLQFRGFARTIMSTGVDYAPLNIESPVRVYVGSQDAQMLAVKVLEFSIRQYASLSVEVFPLHQARIEHPMPREVRNRPRTPFSFQRFAIPALAGYRGRAIYLDSDMQVFQDIRGLWTLPFGDADLLAARDAGDDGRKPQFSVMLLNCEELRWDLAQIVERLDRGELTYETLMYQMAVARKVRAGIDPNWNSLERYRDGETALLHYTDMNTQPWISRANRHGYLWVRDLIAAVDKGFITRELVAEHVAQGFVRPSLLHQVDERIEEAALLPKTARDLDRGYVAPYQKMATHGGNGRGNPFRALRAVLRHFYQKSLLHRVEQRIRKGDTYPIRSGAAGE
jgi:hypothetical protein